MRKYIVVDCIISLNLSDDELLLSNVSSAIVQHLRNNRSVCHVCISHPKITGWAKSRACSGYDITTLKNLCFRFDF